MLANTTQTCRYITQVMKELGAEWKRLDAATKARYADVATADKARFDAEFASNPENAKLKPGKKKKSSGKPKALSAYMHFCAERRPGLTAALKTKLGAEFQNKMVMVNLMTLARTLMLTTPLPRVWLHDSGLNATVNCKCIAVAPITSCIAIPIITGRDHNNSVLIMAMMDWQPQRMMKSFSS